MAHVNFEAFPFWAIDDVGTQFQRFLEDLVQSNRAGCKQHIRDSPL